MTTTDAAERFARVRAAFHRLVDLDLSGRGAALAELESIDGGLAGEVRLLLARTDDADLVAAEVPSPPSRLGAFRLLRSLGRGGMGEVWLAERVEGGFTQRVALKRIRDGALSPDLARRFVRERQILARLQHPNIAHLVDGGIGPDGRPWLAMEYVEGEAIDAWCAARALDATARLRLFVAVCDAVAFAHRNLIVHRDLKPANILVDAEGRPRLLDFGIARPLDPESHDQTGMIAAMTPAYAAPEQRDGGEITTATDVYQLGVVLRELVAAAPGGAAVLRGDLGRLLEKATAAHPSERYAGAAVLAADIADWVDRKPLRSGVGSRRQRVRRTLRQWRWPIALASALVLAFGIGAALALREARAKAREAEVSRQTTQFLVGLLQGADPTIGRGASLSAQDLLDQGSARLRGTAHLQAPVRARLLRTVADSYAALGAYERAREPADEALALRRKEGDPVDVADSLDQVGNLLRLAGDHAGAEPLLREALDLRRRWLPRDDDRVVDSLAHVGTLDAARGDFKAADTSFAEAVAAAERQHGADSLEVARQLDGYAANLDDMGRRGDALELYQRALAIRERVLDPFDVELANTLLNLGVHLSDSGQYAQAARLLERALAIRDRIYGGAHPIVAFAKVALAGAYVETGRLDEAEGLARDAAERLQASLPAAHPRISEALNMGALIRVARRDFTGAIPLQRSVLGSYASTLGASHPDTLVAKNNLAYSLIHADGAPEAEALLREVVAAKRGDNGQAGVNDLQNLASALSLQGKHAEAISWQRRALELQTVREGAVSTATAVALRELAIAEELGGSEAEVDFRRALATASESGRANPVALRGWTVPLAAFLAGAGRCEEALPLLRSALDEFERHKASDPLARPQVDLLLAACAPRASTDAIAQACGSLKALPAVTVDVYPTTRRLLATRCAGRAATD